MCWICFKEGKCHPLQLKSIGISFSFFFSFLLWVVYMGDDEFVNIQIFPSSSCILGPLFCAIKRVRAQWNDWVGQPKSVAWEQLSNLLGRSNKWADKKCQTTNIQTFSNHYAIIIIPCCTLQTFSPQQDELIRKKVFWKAMLVISMLRHPFFTS